MIHNELKFEKKKLWQKQDILYKYVCEKKKENLMNRQKREEEEDGA